MIFEIFRLKGFGIFSIILLSIISTQAFADPEFKLGIGRLISVNGDKNPRQHSTFLLLQADQNLPDQNFTIIDLDFVKTKTVRGKIAAVASPLLFGINAVLSLSACLSLGLLKFRLW